MDRQSKAKTIKAKTIKAKAILEQAGYFCTDGGLGVFDIIAENPLGTRHIIIGTIRPEAMGIIRMQLPMNSTIEQWIFDFKNDNPKIKFLRINYEQ